MVSALLDQGADPNRRDGGSGRAASPLHAATSPEIATLLLRAGASWATLDPREPSVVWYHEKKGRRDVADTIRDWRRAHPGGASGGGQGVGGASRARGGGRGRGGRSSGTSPMVSSTVMVMGMSVATVIDGTETQARTTSRSASSDSDGGGGGSGGGAGGGGGGGGSSSGGGGIASRLDAGDSVPSPYLQHLSQQQYHQHQQRRRQDQRRQQPRAHGQARPAAPKKVRLSFAPVYSATHVLT